MPGEFNCLDKDIENCFMPLLRNLGPQGFVFTGSKDFYVLHIQMQWFGGLFILILRICFHETTRRHIFMLYLNLNVIS